jgi:NlpC/P60 family putative phage cell wall peptidase
MATRTDICAEALRWINTPYHHGQQSRYGCDCIGFVAGVARAVGLLPPSWTMPVYSPQWHWHRNQQVLIETLEALGAPCIALDERQPGDLTLYTFGRVCSHAAILLPDNRIIHAVHRPGRVVIQPLVGDYAQRLHAAYAFPGVTP